MKTKAGDARPRILSFGEILWDVIKGGEVIGGAPFNVAAHAVGCGLQAGIYSRVGNDERGNRARGELRRLGVDDRWVQTDPLRPTGWVDVVLDEHGQPRYRITRDAAWDAIEPPAATGPASLQGVHFDVLVCGTLAQRSDASRDALAAVRKHLRGVPVFYDVNLRGEETPLGVVRATLPGVDIVKLNDAEAENLGRSLGGTAGGPPELFRRLRGEFGVRLMICTKGRDGCSIHSEQGVVDAAGAPVTVVSAVGAGDAFSAAFLAGWLRGRPLEQVARTANLLGGYVASRRETVPEYPPELLVRLQG